MAGCSSPKGAGTLCVCTSELAQKLRALADDVEFYGSIDDPVERERWLAFIAVELNFESHRLAGFDEGMKVAPEVGFLRRMRR
jgi:hypothetical protein